MGGKAVNLGPWRPWKLCQKTWACSEADCKLENQHRGELRQICVLEKQLLWGMRGADEFEI